MGEGSVTQSRYLSVAAERDAWKEAASLLFGVVLSMAQSHPGKSVDDAILAFVHAADTSHTINGF